MPAKLQTLADGLPLALIRDKGRLPNCHDWGTTIAIFDKLTPAERTCHLGNPVPDVIAHASGASRDQAGT
jgi:hypothetical protein